MLKNIPEIMSPELLKILCEMGHGDEIVLADANFPCVELGKRVVRADGIDGCKLLEAIMSLIPLDTYADANFILMQLADKDEGKLKPSIWNSYENIAAKMDTNYKLKWIERYEFYDRAKHAFAIIASGEQQIYANIILKKGVIKTEN